MGLPLAAAARTCPQARRVKSDWSRPLPGVCGEWLCAAQTLPSLPDHHTATPQLPHTTPRAPNMSAARRLAAASPAANPAAASCHGRLHHSHGTVFAHHNRTSATQQQQQQHTASAGGCASHHRASWCTRASGSSGEGPRHGGCASLASQRHHRASWCTRATGSNGEGTRLSSSSPPEQPASLLAAAFRSPPEWSAFLGTLFQQGALLGTMLDGIHSRVGLQVYNLAPITMGPLHTSLLVPPLLGTFYSVLGLLAVAADNLADDATTAAARRRATGDSGIAFVALTFGALAASLALSAALYEQQQPPGTIAAVLAGVTVANWAAFDRTRQGAGLALLCGVGAPAAELFLMAATHCWSYPRADMFAWPIWVPLCYAFYTPSVLNLARFLWATCRPPGSGAEAGAEL